MKKLFLIDAYAMIYRSYYALIQNPRINSKGVNTSAIFGFVNTLEDVLKREHPTHIAVAFDPRGKTFRHEAFSEYKAQRQSTPEDIRFAVPLIKQIVEAYRIPVFEIEGYEADDVIGTIAKKAETEGFEVFMMTADKDYGQLTSDRVFMYKPRFAGGFEKLGAEDIKKRYGLTSQLQIIDFLGLMGDVSDNIPGCPGVGEKTAQKLLQEFGSIENMLANTNRIGGALRKKIEENKEKIEFSRFLATIKTDVPIDFDEEQCSFKAPDDNKLASLFNYLEFRALMEKKGYVNPLEKEKNRQPSLFDMFDEAEKKPSQSPAKTKTVATPQPQPEVKFTFQDLKNINKVPHNYVLVDSEEAISDLTNRLSQQKSVSFDTETTGVNTFTSELVGLSFSWQAGEAYFVTLPKKREETQAILEKFRPFFENEDIEKIGQNIKFDALMLKMYDIDVRGKMFDTMIAHYLIQPELRHGMDYLAEIYLQYRTIRYKELFNNDKKQDIRKVDIELLKNYAAEDADVTFQLKEILEKELKNNALESLFYDIEMPLVRVLVTMELTGVRIDAEALQQSSTALTKQMQKIEKEIIMQTGVQFNVNSPKQVGDMLFDTLKIDNRAKRTKTGQYITSEDVLEKLRSKHPIVGKILDYRGLKKLLSTYIDALPELIDKKTNRIHTSYNQTVTSTGRLSSSNPNLQNIPVRDEQGREIRKAFVANDDDSLFFSADYSQVELRLMAHLSGDENMQEAFNSGQDIHAATASKIYKIPLELVTNDMRRRAKTANFGIIYGISAFGLSERLNISRAEARELIEGYFATYSQVKTYMDTSILKARENGYVETLLGRKRYLADINSQNATVRGFAERNAINAPIQGTAADIIKIAMVRIHRRFEQENIRAKMILQVHDELNFSVPKDELEKVREIVICEMENAVKLNVPLIADCGVGESWFEAH
ncbi:MAG: DNA polymerase I [Prevotellaceae bacterium]|jgi:DNA polymerase-1|nr:DNA polymerase I [Prevotellaceae bacterium]